MRNNEAFGVTYIGMLTVSKGDFVIFLLILNNLKYAADIAATPFKYLRGHRRHICPLRPIKT